MAHPGEMEGIIIGVIDSLTIYIQRPLIAAGPTTMVSPPATGVHLKAIDTSHGADPDGAVGDSHCQLLRGRGMGP